MQAEKVYFDAEGQVVGRLASRVAKEALKGKSVFIVNAEKAVITGSKEFVIKFFREKVERGDPYHGPFYPRIPDRMLRRIIRGMLPYKKPKGKEAFKRVKVYNSVPETLSGANLISPGEAGKSARKKFMTLGELSQRMGAKKTW